MPESLVAKQTRAEAVRERLTKEFPHAEMALTHRNEFELLIATILSAQCTDVRVNLVTPAFFKAAPTPEQMKALGIDGIRKFIASINFCNNKAKNIYLCCEKLLAEFKGQVPKTMEELIELPGVGRKTANVILGNAFEIPGMVVDTHVLRLANRLKFSRQKSPEKVETDLQKVFKQEHWTEWAHLLILHGRKICKAQNPQCRKCVLVEYCPSAFKKADAWKT